MSTVTAATTATDSKSKSISQYIKTISESNRRTGYEYLKRLESFQGFIAQNYDFTIDELTLSKMFNVDVYELLSSYVSYLINKTSDDGYSISSLTIKQRVTTAKNFLEYYDFDISPRKFKLKVKIPKIVRRLREALNREDIVRILEACTSIKLKTFVLCLAATGLRSSECCSIRNTDIDFKKGRINIRGEFTKTKQDHYVFMTSELSEQLNSWLDYKYRARTHYSTLERKNIQYTPIIDDNDLVFASSFVFDKHTKKMRLKTSTAAMAKKDQHKVIKLLYIPLTVQFDRVLDQLRIGYEDASKRRRKITFHSLRRAYKSIVSNLGYSDYSEWALNHKGSPYYQVSEKDKYKIFKKIEPEIVFLDQRIIIERHADMQSRLEVVEKENTVLRQKDSMNADAIASLSDRMQELMSKVHEMEKR
jgi:integrase